MKKFLLTVCFASFAMVFLNAAIGITINAGSIKTYNSAYYKINSGSLTVNSSADNSSQETQSVSASTDFSGPEGTSDAVTLNGSLGSTIVDNHSGVRHASSTKGIYHWWDINPTSEASSTVTFRMRTTDLDSKTLANLLPYEWSTGSWHLLTATYSTSGASGSFSYITYTGFDFSAAKGAHEITLNTEDPLPVVLSQFSAIMVDNIPTINWLTQSEVNNFGWNIYRSPSQSFSQSFKINPEIISGAGTTNQPTRYAFKDTYDIENDTYYYWLESIDYAGATILSNFFKLNIENNNDQPDAPMQILKYGLHQNYPNPFNPDTQISFILKKDGNVSLSIYNLKGEKVKTLLAGELIKKDIFKFVNWNGTNDSGKKVVSGLYFYKLTANKDIKIKKMLLSK